MTNLPRAVPSIDLEYLFKLRIVIARLGEMDNMGWWNTRGILGSTGTFVFRRGFPSTYAFAQARAVFAVAASRCQEVFAPSGCATLWHLPAEIEDQFEDRWQVWLEDRAEWQPFFDRVAAVRQIDVFGLLHGFGLISESDQVATQRLKRSAEGRAVALPDNGRFDESVLALLAAGFALAERGKLAVPYVRVES